MFFPLKIRMKIKKENLRQIDNLKIFLPIFNGYKRSRTVNL